MRLRQIIGPKMDAICHKREQKYVLRCYHVAEYCYHLRGVCNSLSTIFLGHPVYLTNIIIKSINDNQRVAKDEWEM